MRSLVHALAAGAALALAVVPAAASAQDEEVWEPDEPPDEEDGPGRLSVGAWAGEAFETRNDGRSGAALGGEVAWAFDALDLGVSASGYSRVRDATRSVTPVLLLRLTQRFETRRGLEAAITFGAGTARPRDWVAWFQLGLGMRLNLGPVFIGGELSFEQYDIVRVAGGLGFRL